VATSTSTAEKLTARERLLNAADELFYEEGVHTVGIDRVIERAGVAKASLYSAFGSKDELIRAYLGRRHDERSERMTRELAAYDTPREKLLGVYDVLGRTFTKTTFRGCAFINASAESPPGGSVQQMSDISRAWVRALFIDLAAQAGARDPEALGRQLVLLYDGALVSARMDRYTDAAELAKTVAATLLDAALPAPPTSNPPAIGAKSTV
jgi:AcrR family transcriptional regulator